MSIHADAIEAESSVFCRFIGGIFLRIVRPKGGIPSIVVYNENKMKHVLKYLAEYALHDVLLHAAGLI